MIQALPDGERLVALAVLRMSDPGVTGPVSVKEELICLFNPLMWVGLDGHPGQLLHRLMLGRAVRGGPDSIATQVHRACGECETIPVVRGHRYPGAARCVGGVPGPQADHGREVRDPARLAPGSLHGRPPGTERAAAPGTGRTTVRGRLDGSDRVAAQVRARFRRSTQPGDQDPRFGEVMSHNGDQGGYAVAMEALDSYARQARQIAESLGDVRRALFRAGVQDSAFGLLGESGSLHRTYQNRCEEGLDALTQAGIAFDSIADGVKDVHLGYLDAEMKARDGIDQAGSGLGR